MRKITFLRHGNTTKAADDKNGRELTDKGREQAMARAKTLNRSYDLVISSSALRARQTAEIISGGKSGIKEMEALYPTPGQRPAIDAAFEELGYSPVGAYLAKGPKVSEETLDYGVVCWDQILDASDLMNKDANILVVGHAVLLAAIGFIAMIRAGCTDPVALTEVLHVNSGECEGFIIEIDDEGLYAGTLELVK